MVDNKQNDGKRAGRGSVQALNLLGTIFDVGGKLLLGPDHGGIDFGMPFKLGASQIEEKKRRSDLLEMLRGTPATEGIANEIEGLAMQDPELGGGGNLAGTLQELGQAPTGGGYQSINDIPLDRMAEFLPPDVFNQIIASKASQKPADPLDQIKDLLGIQKTQLDIAQKGMELEAFETPEAKRASEAAKFETTERTKRRIAAETVTPKEREDFNKINDTLFTQDRILNSLLEGTNINKIQALGTQGALSFGLMQEAGLIDEKQAQLVKDLNQNIMQTLKLTSGLQFSDQERKFMTASLPNTFDTPEQLVQGMKLLKLKTQYGLMKRVLSKVKTASKPGEFNVTAATNLGLTEKQIKAAAAIEYKLNKSKINPIEYFKNPPSAQDAKFIQAAGLGQFLQ